MPINSDLLSKAITEVGTEGATEQAGAPPSISSVMHDAVKEVGNQQRGLNRLGAMQSLQADPDKFQEFQKIGDEFGVPVDLVGRNYERMKNEFQVRDISRLLDKEPALGRWYTEGNNPAAIKVDELRHLSGLTWLGKSAMDSFSEGRTNVNLSELRWKQLIGQATDDEIGQADMLSSAREPRSYGADSWMEKGWVGAVGQLPIMAQTMIGGVAGGIQGAVAGGAAALLAGQIGPQMAVPEEIVTVPGAAAVGYRIGATAGSFEAAMKLEAGLALDEFLAFRDENGNALDPDVARTAALIVGATNGGLELVGLRTMAKIVPGLDKLSGAVAMDTVKSALMRPTVQQAFKDFGVNILRSAGTETMTEIAQEAVTMFSGELAKQYENAGGADFPAMTGEDMAERLSDAAVQTMQSMTVLGPVLSGTRLGHDVSRARKASQQGLLLDAIIDHAQNDELVKRLPDKAQEAVRRITENGPVQSVFIDPAAFQTYFQNSADLSRFAAEVGVTDEYNEASRTGRDMEVPIEVYYTAIAPTEFGLNTRQYVKLDADDMNTSEADAFNEAWAEAQRSLSEEFQAQQDGERVAFEGSELVFNDVKAKAMDAGIVPDQAEQYAKLYSTFFRVMAERTLQDPGELYARYGFDIRRALPGMQQYRETDGTSIALELMRRGRIDPLRKRVEKARGQSMIARIQQRGGIVDTTGELASIGAQQIIRPSDQTGQESFGGMGDFNQFSADDTLRQLWEEGYFPEFEARPDVSALYDAVAQELAGQARYSVQQDQTSTPEIQRAMELVNFADTLDALGLDPAVMDEETIRAELERIASEDPETGALFQVSPEQARELLQDEGVKRGSIQFADGRTVVNLFEQANLSTFLHESGHFFLEVMRDLATVEGSPAEVMQDWQTVKDYLGITEDGAIPTEAHEKFARSFEAYLFEGKAPSNEVAGIMSRFRSWLVFVYRSIRNLDVEITDDIRRVMDRMIATDDEISAASHSPEFRPAFKSAADAGMTDRQWQDYLATAGRAVEETRRNLTSRMLQDVAREATSEWRAARREIRDTVREEYEKLPVYRAIRYLRTGQAEGLEGVERMHLDRNAIEEMKGEGAALKMPRGTYRREGGIHPDVIAEFFGFASGDEMITRMMSVPPLERAVVEETNRRMRERYGDLMGDAVARSREVSAAIANDAKGDLLAAEMEVLMRKGLVTSRIRKEDARRVARDSIRSKTIRDAVRIKLYMNADAKAAADTERAILEGRWVDAVAAKQRQLLNHYMAMEAMTVEKETTQAVKYLNKFTSRKRPKGIDPEYLDQIEGLLERFDLRKSTTLKQSQRRASLSSWVAQKEAEGAIVAIPDEVRDDALRKSYKEMTVDDLLAVRDSVQSIEHLGKLKDKLLANKKQREFEEVRNEMVAALASHQERRKTPLTRNPTKVDKSLSFMRSIDAMQLKLEQVFDWMDGGDINGPFRKYIWQPIADAEFRENEMREKYAAKVMRIFEGLDKKKLNEWVTVEGTARKQWKRSDIMAVALNMGSESNLDKMMRGEGWDNQPAILDRLIAHLTDAEWKAVQDIWDTIEELWPEIEALQKRLTGVVPPRVEPRKFTTPTGRDMRGGYYPMIYDPSQADIGTEEGLAVIRAQAISDRRVAETDKVMFENVYLRPETRNGFTKERSQRYTAPVLFDLDGFGRHLNEVIHDVTHREAILDANKLLTNPIVRGEIESRYGKELYDQMVPWLQSLAHDPYKKDGLSGLERFARGIRTRATVMAMGFRISTILTQLAGFSSSLEMVNAKQMAGAVKDFVTSPREVWDFVQSQSGEMRSRTQNLDRDIRATISDLTGKTDFISRAQKFAFYGVGYMDRVVVAPTWLAAYREHLAKVPGDEAGAIAAGDRAVRLTQGSGGAKDLSALQRNGELNKLLTMFYSYFSAYYNRQRAWGRDAKRAIASGEVREFPQLLARQVFMTIGPALLGELLVGRGPDDDDDEGWAEWGLKKVAFYPVMAVPVVRDIAGFFESGGRFDYSFTPAERTITEAAIRPIQMIGKIIDGDADPRLVAKTVINTAGYWFGLPTGQLATSIDNVWKGMENDDFQLRDIVLTRPANR